jgi:hypothetical protein
MTTLSDTQRIILSQASQRDDRLALPPDRLPAAARQTVAKALLKQGLVSGEQAGTANAEAWQIGGQIHLLRITEAGLRAIGVEPDPDSSSQATPILPAATEMPALPVAGQGDSHAALEPPPPSPSGDAPEAAQRPPVSPHGAVGRAAALRMAGTAVVSAWDAAEREGLDHAVAALRAVLAAKPGRPSRDPSATRHPRSGTKQDAVLTLLRRDAGASIADVIDATGWQQHTVRGFLAGLKRKDIIVEVLERVRQVGPNKQGAKGSYSIYRIAPAALAEAG